MVSGRKSVTLDLRRPLTVADFLGAESQFIATRAGGEFAESDPWMGNLLLLGQFKNHSDLVAALREWRPLLCHSRESFEFHLFRHQHEAIIVAAPSWSWGLQQFITQVEQKAGVQRWAFLFEWGALPEGSETRHLLLRNGSALPSAGRLRRWLETTQFQDRRSHRQACRGGVRLRNSDYSRQPLERKLYGELKDLSAQGARLLLSQSLPRLEGDFFEISLMDPRGHLRRYHAQIRWQKSPRQGGTEMGVQLLAEAS